MNDPQYSVLQIPKGSPLRNTYSLFWSRRISDEGAGVPDGFHDQVRAGNIDQAIRAKYVVGADGGRGS